MKIADKIINEIKPLDKAMADLEKKMNDPAWKKAQLAKGAEAKQKLAQLRKEAEEREKNFRKAAAKVVKKRKGRGYPENELIMMGAIGANNIQPRELEDDLWHYHSKDGKFALDVTIDTQDKEVIIDKAQTDDKVAIIAAARELGYKVKG